MKDVPIIPINESAILEVGFNVCKKKKGVTIRNRVKYFITYFNKFVYMCSCRPQLDQYNYKTKVNM